MNLVDMFADSTHFKELRESITPNSELQEILMMTQMCVNSFIATIGESLVSDVIADTYMMYGEVFNEEFVKYFSVGAIFYNKKTERQDVLIFPFVMALTDFADMQAGLHFNEKALSR